MNGVMWEEPVAAMRGRKGPDPALVEFAAALRANPKRWARYPYPLANAPSMGTHIRRARASTWEPAGAFDTTTRVVGGARVLYVRYVGDGAA